MKTILTSLLAGCVIAVLVALGAASAAPAVKSEPVRETDLSKLPEPVSAMRERILEGAKSGDVEALRPVLESNELMPSVAFDDITDPIAFWKELSENKDGREILAGMVQILNMPYTVQGAGTDDEIYVWPYLLESDMKALTPPEEVDLYQLMPPSDLKEMVEYGHYIGYRLGISPDGTWQFFLAGD